MPAHAHTRSLPATALLPALLALALLLLAPAANARPLLGTSPYATFSQCFRTKSPQDLLAHPLVLTGDARASGAVEEGLTALLTGLSRDYALRLCRNVALQDQDEELMQDTTDARAQAAMALTPRPRALPLELFDCDILVGDFPLGVSEDFERNKQPVHAVYFQDPVEATLAAYQRIMQQPAHPMHHRLTTMSLHDAIVEAGGLADVDRHHAALPFNTMTWRLCGFDCSPANMTVHAALERATRNLNTRVVAVLLEGSPLWLEMLQTAIRDPSMVASVKRVSKLSAALSPAELSILEHSNFADRILFSIAQGREAQERKCLHAAARHDTRARSTAGM